jgi:hypothetical protein
MGLRRFAGLAVVTLAAATLAAPVAAHAAACTYPLSVLPIPAGAYGGSVRASGGENYFAGMTSSGNHAGIQALRWHGTTLTNLGRLASAPESTTVQDVNASGTVVGHGFLTTGVDEWGWPIGERRPFRSVGDRLEELPVPAGAVDVLALHVLDNGDIYGEGADDRLFRWPAGNPGAVHELAGLPAHAFAHIASADEDGTLAITMRPTLSGASRGYLWKNGVATLLPLPSGANEVVVDEVRNGRVLGRGISTAPYADRPALWDTDGTVKYLGGDADFTFAMNGSALISGFTTAGKSHVWHGIVRGQALASANWSIHTITEGGILAGGDTRQDDPIVLRCY